MSLRSENKRSPQVGAMLLSILILLILVTFMGITMLSSSQLSLRQVGAYRSRLGLEYLAESGLNQAYLRLSDVQQGSDTLSLSNLLNEICAANDPSCTPLNPECPDGPPADAEEKDAETGNTICNFLGVLFPAGRVILVRKEDDTTSQPGVTYAQFLVNVVTYGPNNRRRILQGGVIMQIDPTSLPPILAGQQWFNY